jgi:hypothetical protein
VWNDEAILGDSKDFVMAASVPYVLHTSSAAVGLQNLCEPYRFSLPVVVDSLPNFVQQFIANAKLHADVGIWCAGNCLLCLGLMWLATGCS